MVDPAKIRSGLNKAQERMHRALERAGRQGDNVTLVGVTKTFPAELLSAAIECGISEIGESRVQEFADKKPLVMGSARWHLIGHLQRNKVKKALQLFDIIPQHIDNYFFELQFEHSLKFQISELLNFFFPIYPVPYPQLFPFVSLLELFLL